MTPNSRRYVAVVASLALAMTMVSCGGGTESLRDDSRNAAVIAGTSCRTVGRYARVSGQKVVCGRTLKGKVWFAVSSVKKTKCTALGAVRKNRGVAFVCGRTKSGKFWISTKALPRAGSTLIGVGQPIGGIEGTDQFASPLAPSTPAPDDIVTIQPVRPVSTTTQAPRVLPPVSQLRFADVAVGIGSTCGIIAVNGEVRCWGWNSVGQLGDGTLGSSAVPVPNVVFDGIAHKATKIVTMSGVSYCVIDTNGAVWCWGANDYGQLGNGTFRASALATMASRFDGVAHKAVSMAGGVDQFCAIETTFNAYCWGGGGNVGRYGTQAKPQNFYSTPTGIGGLLNGQALDIAISASAACIHDRSGNVYCWGSNRAGILGDRLPYTDDPVGVQFIRGTGPQAFPVAGLSATDYSMCGNTVAGEVKCWGLGVTGTGTAGFVPQPTTVIGFDKVTRSSVTTWSGGVGSCAMDFSRELWCWGGWDQPKVGVAVNDREPRKVAGISAPQDVGLSSTNVGIIDGSGLLRMFGQNYFGQLGDGTIDEVTAS